MGRLYSTWIRCQNCLEKRYRSQSRTPSSRKPPLPASTRHQFQCILLLHLGTWYSGMGAQDGRACPHLERDGQVQKSRSSCAQGLTFDMEFLCFFRGIWKRLCWVLEASGASGGRGRSEFEQRGLRGGSRVSWPASSQRPDSREGFCFIWLVFLARVHL